MTDRERVAYDIERCISHVPDACRDCSHYWGEDGDATAIDCMEELMADALSMLKEQETEWEHLWDAPDGTFKGRCKKCGFVHFFIEGHDGQYKFCPECERAVKRNADK